MISTDAINETKAEMSGCLFHAHLQAYYDGEMAVEQAQALADHLPMCPSCVAELADLENFQPLQ